MERQIDEVKPAPYSNEPPRIELWMKFGLSLLVLGVGLYIIANKESPPDSQKLASGMIGTVVGYWFRR
jgi:hypothetical protein